MFFKTETIFKVLATRTAADRYMARWFANRSDIRIEMIDGKFFLVG